ncbi:tRNA 2-selenouridine(34) synthase MnmH [Pseudomonas sp.]|uniref:tRNA 2-selenouridine(34) synthase MnmH n=1 Tax=unclassified Pseudomonas TaxID=196821 RepID=UPI00289D8DEE|nr:MULTISPECIES: tRNA 2-selenouridine(34) synthase MnmH [Pseudomonas]
MRDDARDYRSLFLSGVPLMDVRAPVEFSKGAFPGATNRPLMNDIERQKVGTCYKLKGQQAALELGHSLVSGKLKEARVQAWAEFAEANPEGYLYCFRGGLRSQITQQWLLSEAGIAYPRVAGGYKAMRTFLMETLLQSVEECRFVLVGGMTGTGKTEVIAQLDDSVDLEGHANHRGSSFGKRATVQPSQIDFENSLAIDLLRRRAKGQDRFVLEDESRLIGRCSLPFELHQAMQHFPMVWLEDTLEGRVERILKDYVIDLAAEFNREHGDSGFDLFAEQLCKSLSNIAKRLGGERYQRLAEIMNEALAVQKVSGDVGQHREWIRALLSEYYDPMYAYQRENKSGRILFAGDQQSVVSYLKANR